MPKARLRVGTAGLMCFAPVLAMPVLRWLFYSDTPVAGAGRDMLDTTILIMATLLACAGSWTIARVRGRLTERGLGMSIGLSVLVLIGLANALFGLGMLATPLLFRGMH